MDYYTKNLTEYVHQLLHYQKPSINKALDLLITKSSTAIDSAAKAKEKKSPEIAPVLELLSYYEPRAHNIDEAFYLALHLYVLVRSIEMLAQECSRKLDQ